MNESGFERISTSKRKRDGGRAVERAVCRTGTQQQRLEQPRHWIVRGKDSQHERRPERPKVATHRQAPPQDLHNRDGKVGALPDPADAGASMRFSDLSAASEQPEEVGKIHASARAQRVPPPNARVDVEYLEATVARVTLEFNLHQAVITNGRKQANRRFDHPRLFYGFDVRAEPPEVRGKLTRLSG